MDKHFLRKRAKSQKVIFAHSIVNIMGAIGSRALAPIFLHPLQYGGRNLGKVLYANALHIRAGASIYACTGFGPLGQRHGSLVRIPNNCINLIVHE